MGVSLFHRTISKTDADRIITFEMFYDESGIPIYLGVKRSKVKVTSHTVCVGLQTERNIAAGCVRKPRWVFPAAMPVRTSHASDTGFSLRHFPAADAAAARHQPRATDRRPVFPCVEFFAVSQRQSHYRRVCIDMTLF